MVTSMSKIDKSLSISKRIFILNNLEHIIKESVYYRTNSENYIEENKLTIGNIHQSKIKKTIL